MLCSVFLSVGGCQSSRSQNERIPSPGSQAVALGDFDDIHASAQVAVRSIDAVVIRTDVSEGWERLELLTATDEPGELVATAGVGDRIELSVKVGRFGDRRREERLLEAMRRRLAQLHGVETAPVR